MRIFKSPGFDFLEQTYEDATVRQAPNLEESAIINGNTGHVTGLAQGTSSKLFNILINTLLRMLTVTGQNANISDEL